MGRVEARDGVEPPKKGFADLPLAAWVPRHQEQTRVLLPAMIIYRKANSNHRSIHSQMSLPQTGRGGLTTSGMGQNKAADLIDTQPYRMVVVQNRYFTLYPLVIAGGCAPPQASWFQETACSLLWTTSKTMGASGCSPAAALKVTLI
jgi:hypothetical protein